MTVYKKEKKPELHEEEQKDEDMTLTQMADSLVGSESHFSKSLENSLE
jgi:hypothetical protein